MLHDITGSGRGQGRGSSLIHGSVFELDSGSEQSDDSGEEDEAVNLQEFLSTGQIGEACMGDCTCLCQFTYWFLPVVPLSMY
jgi:hypothetical protein